MAEDTGDSYDVFDGINERWPRTGDRLFSLTPTATRVACETDERFYRLVKGYKRAGDHLIEIALGTSADDQNIIYPTVFCYRHFIELALKRLLDKHGPAVDIDYEKIHDIKKLWGRFEALCEAYACEAADGLAAVAACMDELAQVDCNSFSFRFVQTKADEDIALPGGIDLVALRDVMNGIENFFECADLELSARNDSPY